MDNTDFSVELLSFIRERMEFSTPEERIAQIKKARAMTEGLM
jgi:hypothetical protein